MPTQQYSVRPMPREAEGNEVVQNHMWWESNERTEIACPAPITVRRKKPRQRMTSATPPKR